MSLDNELAVWLRVSESDYRLTRWRSRCNAISRPACLPACRQHDNSTACTNKNNPLEEIKPTCQTLYVRIDTTYPTNFIETTDMVRQPTDTADTF